MDVRGETILCLVARQDDLAVELDIARVPNHAQLAGGERFPRDGFALRRVEQLARSSHDARLLLLEQVRHVERRDVVLETGQELADAAGDRAVDCREALSSRLTLGAEQE